MQDYDYFQAIKKVLEIQQKAVDQMSKHKKYSPGAMALRTAVKKLDYETDLRINRIIS